MGFCSRRIVAATDFEWHIQLDVGDSGKAVLEQAFLTSQAEKGTPGPDESYAEYSQSCACSQLHVPLAGPHAFELDIVLEGIFFFPIAIAEACPECIRRASPESKKIQSPDIQTRDETRDY